MAIPKFSLAPTLQLRDGDYLLLPFLDEKKGMIPKTSLAREIQAAAQTNPDAGGALTTFRGKIKGAEILIRTIRLDAKYSDTMREMKKAVASAIADAPKEKCKRVVVSLSDRHVDWMYAVHEGAILGGYIFDKYLSKKAQPLSVVVAGIRSNTAISKKLKENEVIFECVNSARDLLNEPPNVMNPPVLAREFQKLGRRSGLKVTVWDEKRLLKERCGGTYGVGIGAKAKPRMVIAVYTPRGAKKHLCLVGKGVTYDTGGYGIKPAASQIGMKYDMGGAAMMFGAACAISRLKLPIKVTVITPLAENDISGESMHTSAVLTTRSGKTIEVEHTDAEGRLILADGLALAGERKPDWIIDSATLTGACVVALGEEIAGLFSNDSALAQNIVDSGSKEGELYWELPLFMPHSKKIRTTIADVKNRGDAWGGAITAAVFLKEWVSDDAKWAHLDIAGPGGKENPLDHLGKGAKGFGIKTIVRLARTLA
ncbi:MAG: leucyl aminopeptidase family protein [Candidatus Zixiibacteriota bacterium]